MEKKVVIAYPQAWLHSWSFNLKTDVILFTSESIKIRFHGWKTQPRNDNFCSVNNDNTGTTILYSLSPVS